MTTRTVRYGFRIRRRSVWTEKLVGEKVKKWAYNKLLSGEVVFAGDRSKDGYDCLVAEVSLNDNDRARFDVPKGITIIMSPVDRALDIHDLEEPLSMNEINFDLECNE